VTAAHVAGWLCLGEFVCLALFAALCWWSARQCARCGAGKGLRHGFPGEEE
jgi:hypothetical protein